MLPCSDVIKLRPLSPLLQHHELDHTKAHLMHSLSYVADGLYHQTMKHGMLGREDVQAIHWIRTLYECQSCVL